MNPPSLVISWLLLCPCSLHRLVIGPHSRLWNRLHSPGSLKSPHQLGVANPCCGAHLDLVPWFQELGFLPFDKACASALCLSAWYSAWHSVPFIRLCYCVLSVADLPRLSVQQAAILHNSKGAIYILFYGQSSATEAQALHFVVVLLKQMICLCSAHLWPVKWAQAFRRTGWARRWLNSGE